MGHKNENAENQIIEEFDSENEEGKTVNVLYQKIAGKWYSFAVVGDDVFMGEIPEEAINEIRSKELKGHGPAK